VRVRPEELCMYSIRQHPSAYVSIRQHTSILVASSAVMCGCGPRNSIYTKHPSASVSIRQHPSAYVSVRQRTSGVRVRRKELYIYSIYVRIPSIRQYASACVRIRQHTSAYVSIRPHTSAYQAYVSMRQHA
jgi:hypothetical protein